MFTLEYAKNPVWNNAQDTSIFLIVKWEEFVEEMPFNACSFDPEPWGVDLYNRAKIGEFGKVAPYVPPAPPSAETNKKTAISKLQATDWVATVDISNPEISSPYLTNQNAFLTYRSQIREYAVNPVVGNIDWPTEPNAIWSNA
jgi:hypothetical protein